MQPRIKILMGLKTYYCSEFSMYLTDQRCEAMKQSAEGGLSSAMKRSGKRGRPKAASLDLQEELSQLSQLRAPCIGCEGCRARSWMEKQRGDLS